MYKAWVGPMVACKLRLVFGAKRATRFLSIGILISVFQGLHARPPFHQMAAIIQFNGTIQHLESMAGPEVEILIGM